MSKYDKMLELNKRKSEEKVERAVLTIRTMVLEREKVSVPALMQKTGLSRGFFYKNPIVRGEIDAAMEQQAGMVDPRRNIISQAMEAEMNLLRQQLQKLKKGILSPIIGATKTQYLDDSAGAFDIKLTAEDLAYLEEPYVPHEIVGAIDKNPAQGVILLDEKK